MELKRIVGPDMRTALRMVRDQLGPDAIILSNRRTAAGVEIVAGPEESWGGEHTPQPIAAEAPAPRASAAPVHPSASGTVAPRMMAPASAPAFAPVPGAEPPPAADEGIHGLHSELRDLRELLEQRLGEMQFERMSWGPGVEGRAWRRLTRIGLPNDLVHELVHSIDARAGWDEAWGALRVRFAAGLREAGDLAARAGVVAVVGPTGAGKTTTLAKLAVRHVLEHGADGLALASLDATRIGGSDLLRALARLLDVPFFAAQDGEDIAGLLDRCGPQRLLLVDTAGRSRRNAAQQAQFDEIGRLAGRITTLLVLPANAQHAWLGSALADYRAADPAAVVVTKLDETVSLGEVLGAVSRARLPLAYVSDGQEIPDDLHVAQAAALVAQALALDPESEENGGQAARFRRRAAGPSDAARIA